MSASPESVPAPSAPALRTSNLLPAAALAGLGSSPTSQSAAATRRRRRRRGRSTVSARRRPSSVSASGTVQAASDLNVNFETSAPSSASTSWARTMFEQDRSSAGLDLPRSATHHGRQALKASLASAKANLLLAQTGDTVQQRGPTPSRRSSSRASTARAKAPSPRNAPAPPPTHSNRVLRAGVGVSSGQTRARKTPPCSSATRIGRACPSTHDVAPQMTR